MGSQIRVSDSEIFIREATEVDLPRLASIHKSAYSSAHFTTLLSSEVLASYYRYFLTDKVDIVAAVSRSVFEGRIFEEQIVGLAVFGENIPERIAAFKRDYFWRIVLTALRHPMVAIRKVVGRFASMLSRRDIETKIADFLLLSIAVSAPHKGIGARLLTEVRLRAATREHNHVGLYVNTDNIDAINAYFKAGFLIKSVTSQQYYMECKVVS